MTRCVLRRKMFQRRDKVGFNSVNAVCTQSARMWYRFVFHSEFRFEPKCEPTVKCFGFNLDSGLIQL